LSRDEVAAYYKSLFHGKISRTPSFFRGSLAVCCSNIYPEEMYEELKEAFREELIDESIIALEIIERDLAFGKEEVLAKLSERRFGLIDDAIAAMEWWISFQESKPEPAQAKKKKIGRNDPCPCGSGKKYEKCHGRSS
jgi:hypothetical protein